MTLVIILFWAL